MLRYVFQYKFSILLAIVIALLSLTPASSFPYSPIFNIPYIDKIVHISMYGSLGFVALMERRCASQCYRHHFYILFAILVASGLIEVIQAADVLSRGPEWNDLLANLLGLVSGYLAFRLLGGFRIFRFLKS